MNRRFEIRPNSSLTPRGARVFLLTTGIACLGPGVAMLALGYWVVLPFAGLEFAALATATWWSIRKGRYREVIEVDDSTVTVDQYGLSSHIRTRMPVHWCTAHLRPGEKRWSPHKLVLRTGIRECEVASCCTDSERFRLWNRLHSLIGPFNRSPRSRQTDECPEKPVSNQEVRKNVQ